VFFRLKASSCGLSTRETTLDFIGSPPVFTAGPPDREIGFVGFKLSGQ